MNKIVWKDIPIGRVQPLEGDENTQIFIVDSRLVEAPYGPFIAYLSSEAKQNAKGYTVLSFQEKDQKFENYLAKEFNDNGVHPMWVNGWIQSPAILSQMDQQILLHYRKMPGEKIENSDPEYPLLFGSEQWIYLPYAVLLKEARESPDGYLAGMYGLSYSKSSRPVTSMKHLVPSPKRKLISIPNRSKSGAPVRVDGKLFLPVTRYGKSAQHGTYYGDDDFAESPNTHFCGTYYYWEPESDVFLNLGKNLFFPNKIMALYHFDPKNPLIGEILRKYLLFIWAEDYIDHSLEKNNTENTKALLRLFNGTLDPMFLFDDLYRDPKGHYMGGIFHAKEDVLDQALCQSAKKAGYDTIILSQMPGGSRVVSEVLDVRSRTDSLENLYWVVE